jgi:hypothetical protein
MGNSGVKIEGQNKVSTAQVENSASRKTRMFLANRRYLPAVRCGQYETDGKVEVEGR